MKKIVTNKPNIKENVASNESSEPVGDADNGVVASATPDETSDEGVSQSEQIAILEDSLARAKADYQNLRRRSTIEQSNAVRYANVELMRSLLVVVDDFERLLTAAKADAEQTAVAEGLQIVYDNFVRALTSHGLEVIDALHETFDPSVHEAMMQQPTTEFDPGTVIELIAKGYRLGDRVVRPAKVVVATAPPSADSQGASSAADEGAQEANAE